MKHIVVAVFLGISSLGYASGIVGDWESDCMVDSTPEGHKISFRAHASFDDDGKMTQGGRLWDGDKCAGAPIDSQEATAKYTIGKQLTSGATEIDFTDIVTPNGTIAHAYGVFKVATDKLYFSDLAQDLASRPLNVDARRFMNRK